MQIYLRPTTITLDGWDAWWPDEQGQWQTATKLSLAALHELAASWRSAVIVALVPAACMLCTTLVMSAQQYRQGRQGIPYLIEDMLSEDVDRFHVIVGRRDRLSGQVVLMAVEKDYLERLLEALAAAELSPAQVLADALLIPEPVPGEIVIWEDHERILLRLSQQQAGVCDRETLRYALQALGQDTQLRRLYASSAWEEVIPEGQADWLEQLKTQNLTNLQRLGMNFLQGVFKPQVKKNTLDKRWQQVAILAVAACFLAVLDLMSEGLANLHKAQQLEATVEKSYQQLFPGETRIVNLRLQMESHVDEVSSGTKGIVAPMLVLGKAMLVVGLPPPEHVQYQIQGGYDLEFTSDAQHANALIRALQQQGMTAQVSTSSGNLQHVHVGV
ncbi:MAG: hypothetical protein HKM02_05295 [Pseudomonadales bacterium]|nr:hypothetical protein [Pseudomonadales bacterium]